MCPFSNVSAIFFYIICQIIINQLTSAKVGGDNNK